jgi:hypothetical protein
MAKRKQEKDQEAAARRKLADAQARLVSAQEKRNRALQEGEAEIERIRHRVARRLEKVTQEVEQRAGKVARAEARLAAVQRRSTSPPFTSATALTAGGTADLLIELGAGTVDSPTEAAERVEEYQIAAITEELTAPVLTALELVAGEPEQFATAPAPDRYERMLLETLRDGFAEGATFTEWLAATPISKRTFLRARKALLDTGLVTRDGASQGARYTVSPAGLAFLQQS